VQNRGPLRRASSCSRMVRRRFGPLHRWEGTSQRPRSRLWRGPDEVRLPGRLAQRIPRRSLTRGGKAAGSRRGGPARLDRRAGLSGARAGAAVGRSRGPLPSRFSSPAASRLPSWWRETFRATSHARVPYPSRRGRRSRACIRLAACDFMGACQPRGSSLLPAPAP
jgi:hypothetical protein